MTVLIKVTYLRIEELITDSSFQAKNLAWKNLEFSEEFSKEKKSSGAKKRN